MKNFSLFTKSRRTASLLLAALMATLVVGCGDSRNEFVFTNTNNPFIREVDQVLLTPDNTTLSLGQTTTYTLTVTFNDGSISVVDDATFTSDNPGVVTINPNTGVATAVMVGSTTITADNGTFSDSTTVTVTAAPVNNNPALSLVVSNADTDDLDIFTSAVNFTQALAQTFDSSPGADTRNQGIVLDMLGTALHNGGDNVAIISRLFARDGTPAFQTTAFDTDLDREVELGGVANVSAKGSALIEDEGLLVVANFSSTGAPTPSLLVFGTAGTTATELTTGTNRPWDAAYHDGSDTLYVAFTNGTIGVYDDFAAEFTGGTATGLADRTISPNGLDNAHGIVISGNTLVVSDVGPLTLPGDPGFDTDGEIYVISDASTATGAVAADAVISGSNTLLGNPVDIDLQNGDLRVAEKANGGGQILVFTDILNSPGGNIAPTASADYDTPEALAALPAQVTLKPDASDVTIGNSVSNLLVSTNVANAGGPIFRVNTALTTGSSIFNAGIGSEESLKVDGSGDVFITDSLGFSQLGRVGNGQRDGDTFDHTRDRTLFVGDFDEVKGLDISDQDGVIILADNDGDEIHVLGKNATTVAFTVVSNNGSPWDVDYDPGSDTLFVALNENPAEVDIYSNFLANQGTSVINVPINNADRLHGIVHDAANNRLIVSDLGNAVGLGTPDGAIHIINNISAATDGNAVTPDATIDGVASDLEDPVDIAFDGTFIYVAEKFQNFVSRFDISGATPTAPEADTFTVTNPESISLIVDN